MLRSYVAGDEEEPQSGIDSLTDREKEIFELIGRGLTTKEIADRLGGSPRTVEVHRAKIKKKLECETAAQVVRAAVQWVEGQ
jgi:DNA-binding CsgD family transcriptional regulator